MYTFYAGLKGLYNVLLIFPLAANYLYIANSNPDVPSNY